MLEKSGNFAHASELVEIYILYGFRSRCGKMAQQRHLYSFSGEPSGYVSRTCMKSVHSCNITIPTKKSPGTKSETQQEVGYFEFSQSYLVTFLPFAGVIL